MHFGVTDVEAAPDLAAGLDRARALLHGTPNLDGLTPAQQAAVVEIRDAQAATLAIFDTVRGITALGCVPALPHICAYHLTLCGWRRTGHDSTAESGLRADLEHPTGAEGHPLDLTWIPAARDAIAAVLAADGWACHPGKRRIRLCDNAGTPVWVPIDAPDPTPPRFEEPKPWQVIPAITIDPDFEEAKWTATEV